MVRLKYLARTLCSHGTSLFDKELMSQYLIIVESPTKIKTLKRFLGSKYAFSSSVGHIRDLPEKKFGIELDEDVHVDYDILPQKKDVVKKLIQEAKKAKLVYLCPDPDREGEAIAWHIRQVLPKEVKTQRVTFNSITKNEVLKSLSSPREIDTNLVDAQQARRILDRIVGYSISPILVQRVQLGRRGGQGALSAGRVQSVALKLVVDREKEIQAFRSQEYWNIHVQCLDEKSTCSFQATVIQVDQKKISSPTQEQKKNTSIIENEAQAKEIQKRLHGAQLHVEQIIRQERKRNPVAPFITSTLQQEASRHYGFSAQRTMNIAQELYEGIDLGKEGAEGLITYMRTDSVRISPEALGSLRTFITQEFGQEYLHPQVRSFSQKKSTQDAHEAIRPTSLLHPPEKIHSYLSSDQYKLYSLIWKRFVASQMACALYDTVQVQIDTNCEIKLKATGSQLKFSGFLAVYQEKSDDSDEESQKLLPELKEKQPLALERVNLEQSFTKPPPRYTEASLVKALEESGIGRPSTYATIMNKIQSRSYTTKEKGRLKPTLLGQVTTELLENHFEKVMDLNFTAHMEDDLEKVAESQLSWKELILGFWKEFTPLLAQAKDSAHVPKIDTNYPCPKCKEGHLQKIWAGQNFFLGCHRYPECEYRTALEEYEFDKSPYSDKFDWEQKCPNCGSEMKIRKGPYGAFLGCSSYPECKGLVQIPLKGESEQLAKTSKCPAIGCEGTIRARRSRFGKLFYSCSEYPACDVISSSIEEIEQKYANHPKTAAKKKTTKKSAKTKTTKATKTTKKKPSKTKNTEPLVVTDALGKVLSASCHNRPEITKQIWAYIKEHNLQDPQDGRYILCDQTLQAVLGEKRVYMTAIAKAISQHIIK